MHDLDKFARMPALDLIAGQPPIEDMLNAFERECEVPYKGEIYLVRDNGAVFRRVRPNRRRRKLDEFWTFGSADRHSGYLLINVHRVHQIVATAFHGPRPSAGHVVDHIDTNRHNNRHDNLRWLTRLENILLNPITRMKIELAFGSLEAFFENPGAVTVSSWDWMRTVTKEEAQASRRRWLEWVEKGQAGRGGAVGDWLYKPMQFSPPAGEDMLTHDIASVIAAQKEALDVPAFTSAAMEGDAPRRGAVMVRTAPAPEPESPDTPSLTTGAFQRKWRTPTAFPQCPETATDDALQAYLERLTPGTVFARTQYGEHIVEEAAIGPDKKLSVVCSAPPDSVKGSTHARVYIEGEAFCHEAGGTFFTHEGAMKAHCMAIGAPYEAYEGSIDDYC